MSYADVAQKIMPSVVRIVASVPVKGLAGGGFGGGGGGFGGGMDEDQMRELFRQRFPWLFPQDGSDEDFDPRRRKRSAPREDEEDKADQKPKKPNHPSQKGVGLRRDHQRRWLHPHEQPRGGRC